MNPLHRVGKNTAAMALTHFLTPFISLALVFYMTKTAKLGPSVFGQYQIIMTFVGIFIPLSQFGLATLFIRDVARDKSAAGKYLVNGLVVVFVTSLCCMIAMGLILGFKYDHEVRILGWMISLALLTGAASAIGEALFRAHEKFELSACPLLVENLIRVGLAIWLLREGFGLRGVIWATVLASIIRLVIVLALVSRYISKLSFKIDPALCRMLATTGVYFVGLTFLSRIFWRVDMIMLSRIPVENSTLTLMEQVGIYGAARKLLAVAFILPQSLGFALFPVVSRKHATGNGSLKCIVEIAVKSLFIVIMPIAIAITVLSPIIIDMFYGDKFVLAGRALQLLIWTRIPLCGILVMSRVLLASGNQKIDLRINIVGVIGNILLNMALIPPYGYMGAGVATIITLCMFLGLQWAFITKRLFKIELGRDAAKLAFSTAVMGAPLLLFRSQSTLWVLPLSLILYCACIYMLRIVSKKDWQEVSASMEE
ncbi:flippase [Candidatus Hydrogenedentota bacterium]